MEDLMLIRQLADDRIRKEWHEGRCFYSLIDMVAVLLEIDSKAAKNYYHVFKNRLKKKNQKLPSIKTLKAYASDGKMYFTEFTDIEGIALLESYIKPSVRRRKTKLTEWTEDEILIFHPKVIASLQHAGWETQHHFKLPSGNIIDIVASSDGKVYVVECKPLLNKSRLYSAVGQVLCYRQEYNSKASPVIATYCAEVSEYAKWHCDALGILILEIENDVI